MCKEVVQLTKVAKIAQRQTIRRALEQIYEWSIIQTNKSEGGRD